jgi:hypothetical protein
MFYSTKPTTNTLTSPASVTQMFPLKLADKKVIFCTVHLPLTFWMPDFLLRRSVPYETSAAAAAPMLGLNNIAIIKITVNN